MTIHGDSKSKSPSGSALQTIIKMRGCGDPKVGRILLLLMEEQNSARTTHLIGLQHESNTNFRHKISLFMKPQHTHTPSSGNWPSANLTQFVRYWPAVLFRILVIVEKGELLEFFTEVGGGRCCVSVLSQYRI